MLCYLISKTGWTLPQIYQLQFPTYQKLLNGFLSLDKLKNGQQENIVSANEFNSNIPRIIKNK